MTFGLAASDAWSELSLSEPPLTGRHSLIGLGMYDLLFFLSSSSASVSLGLRCGLGVDLITGIAATGVAMDAPYSETDRLTGGVRSGVAMRGINDGRPFEVPAPWWFEDGLEPGIWWPGTDRDRADQNSRDLDMRSMTGSLTDDVVAALGVDERCQDWSIL